MVRSIIGRIKNTFSEVTSIDEVKGLTEVRASDRDSTQDAVSFDSLMNLMERRCFHSSCRLFEIGDYFIQ
jgi:hypothetical protein